VFIAVEFERRNGPPVFIQPRHVASLEPVETVQETETQITMATGVVYHIPARPSEVVKRLKAGA
jgi:hypothetical protein